MGTAYTPRTTNILDPYYFSDFKGIGQTHTSTCVVRSELGHSLAKDRQLLPFKYNIIAQFQL